ncbi:MAG: hypothetical protein IPI55_02065 [Flavobacteriales bacterium]|nr:hypothetical protein [Flavobacteriales bacterium]
MPFEIWREEGVMRVVMGQFMRIGVSEVKEIIRVLGVIDDTGSDPVVLELEEHVRVSPDARCSSPAAARAQVDRSPWWHSTARIVKWATSSANTSNRLSRSARSDMSRMLAIGPADGCAHRACG